MMKTRKIRRKDGAPANPEVSSRARARAGLSVTALAAAATLSFAVPALAFASSGTTGQGSHPVRTVILIGPGSTGSSGPTPPATPKPTPPATPGPGPSPTGAETGCCA